MDKKVIIYKSKGKAIIFIIASLLLIVFGRLFLLYPGKEVIGWCFVILSVFCLIFGIGNFFDRKPYIILTENGITETSSVHDEIEWDAIFRVDEFYYRGQYFIRILLSRDYKPATVRPTWFYRFDKLYEKDGIKAIFLRIGYLEVNSIKLADFMRKMVKTAPQNRIKLLNSFHLS